MGPNGSFSLLIVVSSLIDVGILAGIQRESNGTLGNGETRGSNLRGLGHCTSFVSATFIIAPNLPSLAVLIRMENRFPAELDPTLYFFYLVDLPEMVQEGRIQLARPFTCLGQRSPSRRSQTEKERLLPWHGGSLVCSYSFQRAE